MPPLRFFLAQMLLLPYATRAFKYRNVSRCDWLSNLQQLKHAFLNQHSPGVVSKTLLGQDDSRRDRRTCALVGNSPNLMDRSYGTLIDNSDVVLRMNAGVEVGSGNDSLSLGKKMDVYLSNRDPRAIKIAAYIAGRPHNNVTVIVATDKHSFTKPFVAKTGCHCHGCWCYDIKSVDDLLKRLLGKRPSSGSRYMPLLMNHCSEIRMFGFTNCKGDSSKDRYTGEPPKGHSYVAELEFRQLLSFCLLEPSVILFA